MSSDLASHRHLLAHLESHWPEFLQRRGERLAEQHRLGVAAEKVAENIVEDLFTIALDWPLSDLNHQVDYADIVLTKLGIKQLLIETKHPGALAWSRRAVEAALDQALRYAAEQHVDTVAVSDGLMLYAADVEHGGIQDRVFVDLRAPEPDETLWWLSVDGIWRTRDDVVDAVPDLLPKLPIEVAAKQGGPDLGDTLLHPKYKVPARCFAYVGDASDPHTWKLPYCNADGSLDLKRLPKAIQAILTNYRGAKVQSVPEGAIPDVLVRLAKAAMTAGKMPSQNGKPAKAYVQLREALVQLGRLDEMEETP